MTTNKLALAGLVLGLLALHACSNPTRPTSYATSMQPEISFDWQGHRGARGLLPENSIPAFIKALEYPAITTLELDVVVSSDSQLIVSHEPWFSAEICSHPNGLPVTEEEEKQLNILRMTAAEIRRYDCGKRGHPRFPEQKAMPVHKPTLAEVVSAVDSAAIAMGRPLPRYNIEIKSKAEWDGVYTPPPSEFAQLVISQIRQLRIDKRVCVQSFDERPLREVNREASHLTISQLVENYGGVKFNLEKLGFTPQVYSPHYGLITAETVKVLHDSGIRVIPWTVNTTPEMEQLIEWGVDGIITDYPDRIPRN
jgi:glycerophosphoryl diester phosphodiesterase